VAAELRIVQADLDEPVHRAAVLAMTRDYARDPMGNGSDWTCPVPANT
jgi:hypothetical protein